MATKQQSSAQDNEPALRQGDLQPEGARGRDSVARRLETLRGGRALLGCVRWLVVVGFIASGYCGAAAVHAGFRSDPAGNPHILAASAARK